MNESRLSLWVQLGLDVKGLTDSQNKFLAVDVLITEINCYCVVFGLNKILPGRSCFKLESSSNHVYKHKLNFFTVIYG